ncbi:hypothetical protein [Streptomyces sp. NPDC051014]|uniref:hypothetical protein n=1 Tax=Streptomyces TaxID=1883 RepID=UPI00340010AC
MRTSPVAAAVPPADRALPGVPADAFDADATPRPWRTPTALASPAPPDRTPGAPAGGPRVPAGPPGRAAGPPPRSLALPDEPDEPDEPVVARAPSRACAA